MPAVKKEVSVVEEKKNTTGEERTLYKGAHHALQYSQSVLVF